MRTLSSFKKTIFVAACLATALATAAIDKPRNGAEYLTLSSPQSVQTSGKKVEVIEFFMYHCPACNELEPELEAWISKHLADVSFRRIHIPLTGPQDPEAHLFLTLDAMHLEESLHSKVMRTWHIEHKRMRSDEENIEWASRNGIDKAKFLDLYNSFAVITKLGNLAKVAARYQVEGTPTLVVDGRYLTNLTMVDGSNPGIDRSQLGKATLQVVDALVAQVQKAK
jgi:thiol:disulfide interchange protein DsbA